MMLKLQDLGYTKNQISKLDTVIYSFSKPSNDAKGEPSCIMIGENGSYTASEPITPKVHEAITGELFELGVYKMAGKHFSKHN